MLSTAKPANRLKAISGAQVDDACFEGGDANEGAAAAPEIASGASSHSGPQDLETIAREAGLDDAAVNIS